MYKLLGRPHLEYAAPVWNPHLNVQTFALRMCHKNWDAGYQICIPTLENRKLYLKLCTLYKIMYGYFYFPLNVLYLSKVDFFKIHPPLYQTPAHINYLQSSFAPRTISVWNTLPHIALTATNSTTFRSHVAPSSCNYSRTSKQRTLWDVAFVLPSEVVLFSEVV